MDPKVIVGGYFQDQRGKISYNNEFDASAIKRIYTIENENDLIERAWQGHKIEQRWFSSIIGSFTIKLIKIDNWENPNKYPEISEFHLTSQTLDFLHVPCGFVSYIKANEKGSKLLVLADYLLNEIRDEYKFPVNYFKIQ